MKSSKSRGFTLIELVVVITILGILAAFAVPKFIALDSQARSATINGLAASVKSAAALARGLDMATNAGSTGPVAMEGSMITLVNNYPDATATGIADAINVNAGPTGDFTFAAGASATGTATWTKTGGSNAANCSVAYTAAAAGSTPTVLVTVSGC